jgi:hypothetical protein
MALYRVQVVFDRTAIGEDVAVNTLHFASAAAFDPLGTSSALATHVRDRYLPVMANLHSSHRLERIKVYNASEGGGAYQDLFVDSGGQLTGSLLPLQVAMSVTFRTAIRKRWGRVYIPGWSTIANTAQGRWNGPYRDAVQTTFEAMPTGLPSGLTHVVAVAADDPPASSTPVTAYVVDDVPDIIRRRRAEANVVYSGP